MRKNLAILSILATSLMSYAAMAQDEAAPAPEGGAPAPEAAAPATEPAPAPAPAPEAAPAAAPASSTDAYALRSLTLGAGTFQATLPVVLNLSKNQMLKPVWIPLELRYGVLNELDVFVNHSVPGGPVTSGSGLCLGGKSRGCEKVYNNVNVGGQYSFMKASGLELSGLLAAQFRQFSPDMQFAVDVGVGAKYVAAPVSVKLTPQIGIGVNKRTADNNKEQLAVPLQIAVQAAPQIAAFLDSGIYGPTSHFGDFYTLPVGIGASYLAMHGLDVGLEFMLPMVAKGSKIGGGAADERMLTIFASWRSQ
jgi:hypothetical protein